MKMNVILTKECHDILWANHDRDFLSLSKFFIIPSDLKVTNKDVLPDCTSKRDPKFNEPRWIFNE